MKKATLVARNVKPSHEHDCGACRFLGQLDGSDLYVCEQHIDLVARHGVDGEYRSVPLGLAMAFHRDDGSVYSFAQKLLDRRNADRRAFVPSAYRTS
jgi:hypothetical protein